MYIVRDIHEKEWEKVRRILGRAGSWKINLEGIRMYVLTVPNPEKEGKRWIVGCVGVAEGNRICYLAVEPNHRRKGYGKALLDYADRKIYLSGRIPYLRVKPKNYSAIILYFKFGYRLKGIHKKSLIMGPKKKVESPALEDKEGNIFYWRGLMPKIARKPRNPMKSIKLDTDYVGEVVPELNPRFYEYLHNNLWIRDYDEKAYSILLSLGGKKEWNYWSDKKGTFTTRFKSYCFKEHKLKVEEKFIRMLGNELRDYIPSKYCFQISGDVDWEDGDFADEGSCWWTDGINNEFSDYEHGYAVKFFSPENKNREHGIGRCWMVHDKNLLYLFNARGPSLFKMSNILSSAFEMKTQKVRDLWCNRSSMYFDEWGMAMGYSVPKEEIEEFMMEW